MAHGEISPLDLPRLMPHGYGNRLFLYTMRRMASAGVNDAHAANAMLGAFGRSYRRPLVLMRAMMLEVARCATRRILVAPCCCARMTADEATLMHAISTALQTRLHPTTSSPRCSEPTMCWARSPACRP